MRVAQRSGQVIILMLLGPAITIILLLVLSLWVYPHTPLLIVVVIGLVALVYFLEAALKKRVRRLTANMEYQEK